MRRRLSVPLPWWIVERQIPADRHEPQPHVHVDHVYVAVADSDAPCGAATPAHAFGWYTAEEIAGLDVVEDTRLQAKELLACIEDLAVGMAGGPPDDLASFWRPFLTQQ